MLLHSSFGLLLNLRCSSYSFFTSARISSLRSNFSSKPLSFGVFDFLAVWKYWFKISSQVLESFELGMTCLLYISNNGQTDYCIKRGFNLSNMLRGILYLLPNLTAGICCSFIMRYAVEVLTCSLSQNSLTVI